MVSPVRTEPLADIALLDLISHKDEVAFDTIFRRYGRVIAWTARTSINIDQAEDAVQLTFFTLWKKASKISLEGDSLLPWLVGTCKMQCRNLLAKERRKQTVPLDDSDAYKDASPPPDELLLAKEMAEQLNSAVAALAPIDQAIYDLCITQGLSYDQAAAILNASHGTIRNRLFRLRKKLQSDITTEQEAHR